MREAGHPRQQHCEQSSQEEHREGQPDLVAHPCRGDLGLEKAWEVWVIGTLAPLFLPGLLVVGSETWSLKKLQVAAAAAAAKAPSEWEARTFKG